MLHIKDADFFEVEDEDFDTILAKDITFTGIIRFKKPFMIKGNVSGSIDAISDLVVDDEATVEANIIAKRVLIRGAVKGNIDSQGLVFVSSTGSVEGDITSPKVVLEPGSMFTGRCTMIKDNNE